ncbi:MAG: lipid asymmetry maintenance protein MlaB [Aquincola tertiaricarbonis]|uniref:STAS domain-containing protein n=1 Tax=Aquincola TaxID=391952 RepID=UPI00061529A8|nr:MULTISPECIES: STAS domain-containing protein [Aquincola]MCR5865598.1 STAS domain-containing protein [Aquincola sp. J276]
MLPLPSRLTFPDACGVLTQLESTLESKPAGVLQIDGSALQVFDSSAIAVLLESRRAALAAGHGFEVTGLPAPLVELAGLYGVAELLQPPGAA